MLALTFSTGIVDAVGYLGLDRVFTGNMTGNVVILGMALTGAEDLPVVGPLLALAGFMAGAALSGRMLRQVEPGWGRQATGLLSLVAGVMLGVGIFLMFAGDGLGRALQIGMTTVLGTAMGVQAATARFLAVKDVTTVVVTSTITGLAADSVLGGGNGNGGGRRASAVALILAGAAVGALLLRWELGAGLVVAGGVVAVVTALGALHAHRHASTAALVGG
jgi:uncharacterized membrane protein YoaK (UPF0700 family)